MELNESRTKKFWAMVAKRGANECWRWVGAKNHGGYGVFGGGDPKYGCPQVRAHRQTYEMANGPIPAGMLVMHSCDNPSCVNPAHLSIGTQADNMRDMSSKQRRHGSKNPRAQLTEAQVREIRLLQEKVPKSRLALTYGVSDSLISDILARRTWAHLD